MHSSYKKRQKKRERVVKVKRERENLLLNQESKNIQNQNKDYLIQVFSVLILYIHLH